jgi:hypothetical protein
MNKRTCNLRANSVPCIPPMLGVAEDVIPRKRSRRLVMASGSRQMLWVPSGFLCRKFEQKGVGPVIGSPPQENLGCGNRVRLFGIVNPAIVHEPAGVMQKENFDRTEKGTISSICSVHRKGREMSESSRRLCGKANKKLWKRARRVAEEAQRRAEFLRIEHYLRGSSLYVLLSSSPRAGLSDPLGYWNDHALRVPSSLQPNCGHLTKSFSRRWDARIPQIDLPARCRC